MCPASSGKEKMLAGIFLEKYQKYESCFTGLGSGATLSDESFNQLQEYVCLLYSRKTKNVKAEA